MVLIGIALTIFLLRQELHNPVIKVIQSDCHFEHGLCELELSEAVSLSFQLTPNGTPAMEPLYLTIAGLEGFDDAHRVLKVWFEGKNMYMGQHFMLPVQEPAAKGIAHLNDALSLRGMIPVCSVDENMVWRLVVELPLEQEKSITFLENQRRQQIHFELP